MSAYKKLLPQDYSIIPFNAHKQYTFNSASAASNKIEYFTASYNSTSIDFFNSGNVKYSQIDHLFYKDYKTSIDNKFGSINYLKQQRNLYDQVNILSIPIGLQGHKIKPGSFILSSSGKKIIDDSYGNILIEGTEPNNYCIDFRSVLLNIGPVKGFKKYNLNVYDGYIGSSRYYKKGLNKVNLVDSYSTPNNQYETDDSYFLNQFYYKDVTFSEKLLSIGPVINSESKYPGINFNGTSS